MGIVRRIVSALMVLLAIDGISAFAPLHVARLESSTSLKASSNPNNNNKLAAGAVAAALFVNAAFSATPALAALDDFGVGSSSQVLAARSGGRMGGRSMGGRSSFRAPTSYRSSTTIVRPMMAAPPVVISPFGGGYGYGGFGYNPLGGFGLGYGLGAVQNSANTMRDYQQESEIQRSKAELEEAKAKEAELEARLKALEEAQK